MKTTFGGVAALALTLAVGGAAIAQTHVQTQASAAAPQRARMAEPVSQADFVQRRVARLRAADANRDGQVTAEEARAFAQARRAEARAAQFDRLDVNKDGVLSRDEFEVAGAPQAPRPGAERRFPIDIANAERAAAEAFARMDANRDGALSVEERRMERRPAAASPSTPASE